MSIRVKATIFVHAKLGNTDAGVPIPVRFNPEKLKDAFTANFASQARNDNATQAFSHTSRQDFSVDLFYDTTDLPVGRARNVQLLVKPLRELLLPSVLYQGAKAPALCTFVYGTFAYTGYVTNFSANYTLFSQEGFPIRAEVALTLKSNDGDEKSSRFSSLANSRKQWTVRAGDRLDSIAYRRLGDAALWPLIAKANNIADPLSFPTDAQLGTSLIIPHV